MQVSKIRYIGPVLVKLEKYIIKDLKQVSIINSILSQFYVICESQT